MPSARNSEPRPSSTALVYVDASMPGYSRIRRGSTFRFKNTEGQWLTDDADIARIRKLAIPPAYRKVWICPLSNGHLQATGVDARGRKQYRYHAEWRIQKDEAKFERLEAFGLALPKIRRRVTRDLQGGSVGIPTRSIVLATIVRLLDTTFLRVGNEAYAAENGSFGLTTLRNRHARVEGGQLQLRFRGKSGVMHEARIDDPKIAKLVRRCQQLPGQDLFQYIGDDGSTHGISSTDVNDYIREAAGAEFTAKDFRTWHGTVQALELTRLACQRSNGDATPRQTYNAKEILAAVAQRLGNTPAVCKKAYVHPAVLTLGGTLATDGDTMTEVWNRISRGKTRRLLHAAEVRLIEFLRDHRRQQKSRRPSKNGGEMRALLARSVAKAKAKAESATMAS